MKIRVLFRFVLFHLLFLSLLRVIFYFVFKTPSGYSGAELVKAFYLGAKFDLRLILLLALPLIFVGWGDFQPLTSLKTRRVWSFVYVFLMAGVAITYILDFGHYGYLATRINATVFAFLKDPDISGQMLWQSYPVIWITLGFLLFLGIYYRLFISLILKTRKTYIVWIPPSALLLSFVVVFLYGLYGHFSQYPLRWSDAFFSPHHFLSHLSLNPVLYLVETSEFQDRKTVDIDKVRGSYSTLAPYLGVDHPDENTLNFSRKVSAADGTTHPSAGASPLNVVVIVMESMAISKTSLTANPLRPTPSLEALAKDSYWFSNYYSPTEGTARNMFGIMTAIPDVYKGETSSRNPLTVDQHVIMNDYDNYKKWYFLGGSASWANIRGIFSHNIEGIEIIEEGSFAKSRTDVWGISDLDLFIEAHRRFADHPKDKPFVAVIQTASFHRPYTIPKDSKGFKNLNVDLKSLKEAGFYSLEQFNSLRFSDFSLGYFFKLARKSGYYKNTLFIVTGDHGLPDDGGVNVTEARQALILEKYHVPLILHNKQLFPSTFNDSRPAGHLDVMTTAASLARVNHVNTTLGRNLFDARFDKERYAFIYNYSSVANEYGLLNEDYYYRHDDVIGDQFYNYSADSGAKDVKEQFPELFQRMKALAQAYYETARYMLYNNKKHQP